MRGWLALGMLAAQTLAGASYTASKSGNWTDPATWGGAGTPGSGDTAVIGAFTVTIPSGSSVAVGNPVVAGDAILLNNTNAKLVVNGNLTLQGHLRCSAGAASLEFAVTGGPVMVTLKSSTAVTPAIITSGTSNSSAKWTFTGAPGQRVLITTDTTAGGNPGYVDASSGVQLLWTHVILSGLGSATQSALVNARNAIWDYVLIRDCGLVQIQPTSASSAVDLNHTDLRTSRRTTSYGFQYTHPADLTGGIRRIRNSTFVAPVQASYLFLNATDLVMEHNVFDWSSINLSTNGKRQSYTNCFFSGQPLTGQSSSEAIVLSAEAGVSFENCAFITNPTDSENNHWCNEKTAALGAGPNTWNNVVVDGVSGSGAGDFVLSGGAHSITNSLFLNQFGNVSDGLYAGSKQVIRNITAWNNTRLVNGGVIVISETNPAPTKAVAHRNNIFSSVLHGVCQGSNVAGRWNRQTGYSLDYNAYWDLKSTENFVNQASGELTYLYRPSVSMSLTKNTCSAGTTAEEVWVSGGKLITDGVKPGDVVFSRGQYALVTSVISETQLTLGTTIGGGRGIANLTAGDTITVYQGYWSDGGTYGDSDKGLHDLAADPQFRDTTRNVLAWDSRNGGPGTLEHVRAEIVKMNGYDAAGSPAAFDPAYEVGDFLTYVRYGFTPTNPRLKNAGSPADGSPDLGAVPMYQFGAVPAVAF